MDPQEVRRLLRRGNTPRQVARALGGSRTEVLRFVANAKKKVWYLHPAFHICFSVLAVGMVLVMIYVLKDPEDLEIHSRILNAASALPRDIVVGSSWIMERVPSSIKEQASIIEAMAARVNDALVKNSGLDIPGTKEEMELFGGHLMPTMFVSGGSVWVGEDSRLAMDPLKLEVMFYSHDAFTHPRIGRRLFYYDPSWSALGVAALKLQDELWYRAIIAHELWHAKRHREGAASATAPILSDAWVDEELEAHALESAVLDGWTQGAYYRKLTAIVEGGSTRSVKRFLARVTPQDIVKLNRSFGPMKEEEVDTRVAQYYLDLSVIWLRARYQGPELEERKRQAYRFLISPHSTNVQ